MSIDDDIAKLEAKEKRASGEAAALAESATMNRIAAQGAATQTGLLLVKLDKKQWALPWAHFGGAEYFPAESGDSAALERIEMVFLHQAVTLHGRNLAALMRPIKELRLDSVPELPVRYLETDAVRNGEAAVTRIEVVPR